MPAVRIRAGNPPHLVPGERAATVSATLKQVDPTQVELEIAISPEEFEKAQDAAFRKLVRNAKVPGFRPGKVPRKIFENTYGLGAIVDRALEDLVPEKYAEAVKEHSIEPIARPSMEFLPEEEGQPMRFKALVAVRPPIEPPPYEGLEITEVSEKAGDEDLTRALETMRRDAATLVPADRPVKLGDIATIDYAGKIDGVAFEGGTATSQQAEIAEERFIPGFARGIVGMAAGDTKDITAKFPDDYGQADLAGKDATFTITVHEIKEPELPALDDEFAKRVSQHETLEALTTELRGRLDTVAAQKARRQMSTELIERLTAGATFPLPQVLVEGEIDSLLNESRQYVARMGVSWDDYLKNSEKTEEAIRNDFREEAERRVKTSLLIEEIAKREKIEASEADIRAELEALARQYGQPEEKILELLGRNVGALVDGIVRTKTIDHLIERAKRIPATKTE
jgi:trigger factor